MEIAATLQCWMHFVPYVRDRTRVVSGPEHKSQITNHTLLGSDRPATAT